MEGVISKEAEDNLGLSQKQEHTTCEFPMGKRRNTACVGCSLSWERDKMQLVLVGVFSSEAAYNLCWSFLIRSSIQLVLLISHKKRHTTVVAWCYLDTCKTQLGLVGGFSKGATYN